MLPRLYRALYRIRRVEEEIARAYPSDKIKSPVHLSIGQEAVSVGVCDALRPEDVVYGTYRGHALYLAKGGDMAAMVAELYGKSGGCTSGKGGSMHLIDATKGVMGMSAVVGTTIANAVGHAYVMKYRKRDNIVASFFGDGASEEGVFAESLNFAVLKKLPILFVCENNRYAIHTHQSRRQGNTQIADRARAFGMEAFRLDGNDVTALRQVAANVVERLRDGQGPIFFEVMTYRWREHVGPNSDFGLGYRTESECDPWRESDAVVRLANLLDRGTRQAIEDECEMEIRDAFDFAEASPFPEAAELMTRIYAEV